MIKIVEDYRHFLDYLYGPMDIDPKLYEKVTEAYESLCVANDTTPKYEEVEAWIFRRAVAAVMERDEAYNGPSYYTQDELRQRENELVSDYIEAYGDSICFEIKKSLDHAGVSYLISDEDDDGNPIEVITNSAQVYLDKNSLEEMMT